MWLRKLVPPLFVSQWSKEFWLYVACKICKRNHKKKNNSGSFGFFFFFEITDRNILLIVISFVYRVKGNGNTWLTLTFPCTSGRTCAPHKTADPLSPHHMFSWVAVSVWYEVSRAIDPSKIVLRLCLKLFKVISVPCVPNCPRCSSPLFKFLHCQFLLQHSK